MQDTKIVKLFCLFPFSGQSSLFDGSFFWTERQNARRLVIYIQNVTSWWQKLKSSSTMFALSLKLQAWKAQYNNEKPSCFTRLHVRVVWDNVFIAVYPFYKTSYPVLSSSYSTVARYWVQDIWFQWDRAASEAR